VDAEKIRISKTEVLSCVKFNYLVEERFEVVFTRKNLRLLGNEKRSSWWSMEPFSSEN